MARFQVKAMKVEGRAVLAVVDTALDPKDGDYIVDIYNKKNWFDAEVRADNMNHEWEWARFKARSAK